MSVRPRTHSRRTHAGLIPTVQKHTASPKVWGAAYHIPACKAAEVREYLDIREINGYSMQYTPFHVSATTSEPSQKEASFSCLVYIGLPDNPQFLGPQDQQPLAEHILKSTGPSGENREYLYMLDEVLTGLSDESRDEHIHDLARRCRELEQAHGGDLGNTVRDGVPGTLKRVGSTQEQEEVEREEEMHRDEESDLALSSILRAYALVFGVEDNGSSFLRRLLYLLSILLVHETFELELEIGMVIEIGYVNKDTAPSPQHRSIGKNYSCSNNVKFPIC
ncbi:hypothetical protein LTR60_003009 [Cryomyces antarcticus]|nr:hypothetical protein LTR60_003009 [Cryomyces antarcticus]